MALNWAFFINSTCGILVVLSLIMVESTPEIRNQLFGIRFISYDNFDGTLADGTCCDEPGKTAGSCKPDLCDTGFYMCASTDGERPCSGNVIKQQGTAITYNNNTFDFGRFIGNKDANGTSSLIVLKFPFIKHNIHFFIEAVEKPELGQTGPSQDIAKFDFIVDWVDLIFPIHPKFRRQILNDTRAQLVVDVVSQCSNHYYAEDCSVYCKLDKEHYICLDNGTKECLPGWSGPDCCTIIDYCPGNKCQHGSTCVPILLNYRCNCTIDYTGYYCETRVITTTTQTPISHTITRNSVQPSTVWPTNTTSTIRMTSGTTTVTVPTAVPTLDLSTVGVTKKSTETSLKDTVDALGKSSKSMSSDTDEINTDGLASGVTIGLLTLGVAALGLGYYIVKKKKMSRVAPEEPPPTEGDVETVNTTNRKMDAYVISDRDALQVAPEEPPPTDVDVETENAGNGRMDAYVIRDPQ